LEVCINTDNRSLHARAADAPTEIDRPDDPRWSGGDGKQLTDEYLQAARLSGGLTRWEVLKLIRAGFKHAFLHRQDIRDLLDAIECRLFSSVGQEAGTSWRYRR
jgi:hypothetical protein